ncbi:MAG: O-antigen ligase family protein [Maribacter sp.]
MRKKISLLSKSYFLIIGLFTFSRTFIISWILINLLSIKLNIKNLKLLLIGFGFLSTLLVYNSFLPVKNQRLEQIGALINGGSSTKSSKIEKDSRWDTWSRYYPALMDKPIFGNGFNSFTGNGVAPPVGVHNTYLLLWGEGGILSALLFLFYTIWLFVKSSKIFMRQPHVLMILLGLSLFLLTNHNFMTANYSIFILLWIHIQVKENFNKEDFINLKVNKIKT